MTTLARELQCAGSVLSVTRATPDGDEVVRAKLPALVTVTSELGAPRFPSAKAKMAARKMNAQLIAIDTLGLDAAALEPQVVLKRQFVPQVQGNCEFLSGTPAQIVQALMQHIRQA